MGWGTRINREKAIEWYRMAAAKGHKTAIVELQQMEEEGESVRGAFGGEGEENELGELPRILEEGTAVDREGTMDPEELFRAGMECINDEIPFIKRIWTPGLKQAEVWFRKAGNLGHEEAQYNMGRWLESGWGVETDRAEAAAWYGKAAAQGHEEAAEAIDRLREESDEAKEDDAMMRNLRNEIPGFAMAGQNGFKNTSRMGGKGGGGGGDGDAAWEAPKTFGLDNSKVLATRVVRPGMDNDSKMDEGKSGGGSGGRSKADAEEEAAPVWTAPARSGLDNSAPLVGAGATHRGRLAGDRDEGKRSEGKSGDSGGGGGGGKTQDAGDGDDDPDALYAAGMECIKGTLPDADRKNVFMPSLTAASKKFRKAADQGHCQSQYLMGRWLEMGWGVMREPEQAAEWYEKASAQGHSEAAEFLAAMD